MLCCSVCVIDAGMSDCLSLGVRCRISSSSASMLESSSDNFVVTLEGRVKFSVDSAISNDVRPVKRQTELCHIKNVSLCLI